MENQLSIFNFEGYEVRFVDDKPVANDVASILGYADPAKTVSTKVKLKYRSVTKMVTVDGKLRDVTVLEEGGIYQLILSSKLPIADKFQDWLFEEVLPSIRKTGSYSIQPLSPAQAIIKSLELWESVQIEQQRQAVELAVTKALAEQTSTLAIATDSKVAALELELATLKNILSQPIPACKQTARQRIVEIAQLTATYLVNKGKFTSIQEAIRTVWNRINLKVRNSSLAIDLAARKANSVKQFDKDYQAWETAGKPKGQKPIKKNYPNTYPALIESLAIEQPALECVVSVAQELVTA